MGNTLTFLAEISEADWANTPERVKQLVKRLVEQIAALEAGQQALQEQIQRNSQNSSQPPSQDAPKGFEPKPKKKSGKARGGQPGHAGHAQELYPPEQCADSEDHYPETCIECGHSLQGEDTHPYRCQIIELPPLQPVVFEHRFHALECPCCGVSTRAYDAQIINGSRYGERLCSLVALLSGEYRQSHQMVVRLLNEWFEIPISVGSVGRVRQEISEAVAVPVDATHVYVQQQPVVGVDETSLPQGNGDGNNAQGKRGWLWVVVTPLVCYFQVSLSRSKAVAQALLGVNFAGIVNSDRYSSYNWLALQRRQLCWAHLKRDFTKIAERSGVSESLGQRLLQQQEQLFELWHRVRDGTLARTLFILEVAPIRQQVQALLKEGAQYPLGEKEKTPLAKTVRTCQQLLKVEPALWLFVAVEGVEPTNNAAERAIRPAVLWRRSSYGSQSEAGSLFVSRMMTVVTTLRCQKRNVLNYLAEACRAKRQGLPPPSLLPLAQPPLPTLSVP